MTTLGDDLAEALPELQAEAESMMRDKIRFTRPDPDGAPVWDDESESYVAPVVEVYHGKCKFRWGNPAPQEADAGETIWAVDRTPTVSLPMSDPTAADVGDGHTGTITAVAPGSGLRVGMVVTAMTPHRQTYQTARRIPVQVVSRDVG